MKHDQPHELEDRHRQALAVLVQWLDAQCPSLDMHAGTMRNALQGLELMAAKQVTLEARLEVVEHERDAARTGWKECIGWGGRMEAERDQARGELRAVFTMANEAKGEAIEFQEKVYALQRQLAEQEWTGEPDEEFQWDSQPSPRMQSDFMLMGKPLAKEEN
jgi:hypothetical protein